jgi:hypothetical protein
MNKSVIITTETGYGDCDDCGGYDWGNVMFTFSYGAIQEYEYCNHMGPGLPCAIDDWGTPHDFQSFVQGYAKALIDQGFDITHVDNTQDDY